MVDLKVLRRYAVHDRLLLVHSCFIFCMETLNIIYQCKDSLEYVAILFDEFN